MFDALLAHGADIEAAVAENGTLFHFVVYSFVDSDNAALMNHFLDWIQAQLDAAETPAQLRAALNRLSRQLHIHHKNDDDLNVTEYLSRQLRNSPDDESLQRAFRYAVLLSGEVFPVLPETINPLMLESLKVREYIEREYLEGRPHPLSNVLPRDVVNQIVGIIRQQELCAELNDLDRAELVALGKFLGVEDFDDTTFFIEKDVLCSVISEHLAQGGSRSAPQSPVPKQSGVQELIWAIEARSLPVLANLLKLGQDPNELDSFQRDGKTAYLRPLNVALAEADGPEGVSVVKILLRGGADPLLGNQRAENAVAHLGTLHHSAETMDQLKALMARYVDFNDSEMIVDWLMGKLYAAVNDDDEPLAKTEAVFEQGVNLPAKYYIRGMTPFQWVDDTLLRSKDGDYPRDEIMNLLQTRLR
jgi:ankyrin repeat protein